MILAAVRDDFYNVILLIHIVSFLVGFAPAVLNPLLERHFAANGGDEVIRNWAGFSSTYTQRFGLGALGVLFVTGILMIVLSEDVFEFSQTWISLSFLVWFAIAGVVSAMILKGERQVAAGDMAGRALVEKGGKIASVLTVVMLYLMIFKPGF